MGSDRARVSYDPRQQYRSVVMQQGRVTLEADWNEAQEILTEEMRKEALDFVGPSGTPDDGYGVVPGNQSSAVPFDFYVRPGIMYVGGVRVQLPHPVQYSNQPDWLDRGPEDPDPGDLATIGTKQPKDEFVYLLLREQEVSAVEDPDLKDVALGGPDTAQRTRLLQRFARVACNGSTCDAGLAAAAAKWQAEGLAFDPANMRLLSDASLQVHFSGQSQTDPCQPNAQGGYLAPDNQFIRVQISGVDALTGLPKFLWGFDDASFLYRVDIDPNNPQSLILQSAPPDAAHQPAAGQAVEILRAAAELSNGGFVAALSGFPVTLNEAYDPDSQSITLPTGVSLPADFLTSSASPPSPLFLRAWQQEVVFTPGQAAALGDTGLQVTLATPNSGPFHLGDYWFFAVRPATPQVVYPERYLASPQPPDGPRLWACPLGVIAWLRTIGTLTADCRNTFCTLSELCKKQQGCCTYTVNPQDLSAGKTLQSIIYKASRPTMLVQAAFAGAPGNNITVEISNLQPDASPASFDLTVMETDTYLGVTVLGLSQVMGNETGGFNDGLAHVLSKSVTQLTPLNNQTVSFTGGQGTTKAQASFRDSTNQSIAFTLEARSAGIDGNTIQASVSNVSGAAFDLSVSWQRKLGGVTMGTLLPAVQANFGFVIIASPPTTVAPAFPAEGVTSLSGGVDTPAGAVGGSATAQAAIFGNPVKICLRPGTYRLAAPLVFGPEQSNITLEGCPSATLAPVTESSPNFAQGLLQINGASQITLHGLTFLLPRVTLRTTGLNLGGLSPTVLASVGESALISLDSAIAVVVMGVRGLTVEACTFQYPSLLLDELLFTGGLFVGADCSGISLKQNLFRGPAAISATSTTSNSGLSGAVSYGYLQADSLQFLSLNAAATGVTGGALIPSSLDNLRVEGNSFQNLEFPVYIMSTVGAAIFDANIVRSSRSGFSLLPLAATVSSANQALTNDVRTQSLRNPAAQRLASIAVAFPRPASFVPSRQILVSDAAVDLSTNVLTSVTRIPLTPIAAAPIGARAAVPPPVVSTAPTAPAPVGTTTPAGGIVTGTAPPQASTPAPPAVLALPTLSPLSARIAELVSHITAAAVNFNPFQGPLDFSIEFTKNDIEALSGTGSTLWALSVLDSETTTTGANAPTAFGSLTLSGNKLRNSSPAGGNVTATLMVRYCAVAGNVIINQTAGGGSLSVVVMNAAGANTANAAITGNVLMGTTSLPPRFPASLPDWTTYNCLL